MRVSTAGSGDRMADADSSFGVFWDPNEPDLRVAGRLEWGDLGAPVLKLLDPPPRNWGGVDFSWGFFIDGTAAVLMLHGRLSGRAEATLLDCAMRGAQHGKTSTFELSVGHLLLGVWLDRADEPFFRRVELNMPALTPLLGLHPITGPTCPTHPSGSPGATPRVDHRSTPTPSWRSGPRSLRRGGTGGPGRRRQQPRCTTA